MENVIMNNNCDFNLLAISHSGLRLCRFDEKNNHTKFEHITFWDITECNVLNSKTVCLTLINKNEIKFSLYSQRASQVKQMIDEYRSQSNKNIEFVQAIKDFLIKNETDKSLLNFKKNDIIKLNNMSSSPSSTSLVATPPPKCWYNGILNEKQGLFPIEYVRPVNLNSASNNSDLTKNITTNLSTNIIDPTLSQAFNNNSSNISSSSGNSSGGTSSSNSKSEGYYSMMEFAMLNFKSSLKYLEK